MKKMFQGRILVRYHSAHPTTPTSLLIKMILIEPSPDLGTYFLSQTDTMNYLNKKFQIPFFSDIFI